MSTLSELPIEELIALKMEHSFRNHFRFRLTNGRFRNEVSAIVNEAYYLFLASVYKIPERVAQIEYRPWPAILNNYLKYNVCYKLRQAKYSRKDYNSLKDVVYCKDFGNEQWKLMQRLVQKTEDRTPLAAKTKRIFETKQTKYLVNTFAKLAFKLEKPKKIIEENLALLDRVDYNLYNFFRTTAESEKLQEEVHAKLLFPESPKIRLTSKNKGEKENETLVETKGKSDQELLFRRFKQQSVCWRQSSAERDVLRSRGNKVPTVATGGTISPSEINTKQKQKGRLRARSRGSKKLLDNILKKLKEIEKEPN